MSAFKSVGVRSPLSRRGPTATATMPRKTGPKKFQSVKVHDDHVLVSGGLNSNPEPCPFRTAKYDNGEELRFLRVEAREPWLIKGACGDKRVTDGMSNRTTLVRELRAKLEEACGSGITARGEIRCSGEAAGSVVADDPMAAVAVDEVVVAARVETKLAHRRSRYVSNNTKHKIIEVLMPKRAPETGLDEGERLVRLYCESRQKIWLCIQEADWALQYLRDQLVVKGVQRVAADDIGPGGGHDAPFLDGPPGQLPIEHWVPSP